MMNRFSSRTGAIALLSVGALYLIISLASGHSAASEPPPDLVAEGAGIDVWRAAALMVEQPDACIVDLRDEEHFELYHLPRAQRADAESAAVRELCVGRKVILVVASTDAEAAQVVGALRGDLGDGPAGAGVHYLLDGVRSWYLTFTLPVPLFSEKAPPYGYAEALARLDGWLAKGAKPDRRVLEETLGLLIRAAYLPTALKSKGKKAGGKKRKKISGGCG